MTYSVNAKMLMPRDLVIILYGSCGWGYSVREKGKNCAMKSGTLYSLADSLVNTLLDLAWSGLVVFVQLTLIGATDKRTMARTACPKVELSPSHFCGIPRGSTRRSIERSGAGPRRND